MVSFVIPSSEIRICTSVSCLALSMRFCARKRAACRVRGNGWNSGLDLPNAFRVATDGEPEVGLPELFEFMEDRLDPFGDVAAELAVLGERKFDFWDAGPEFVRGRALGCVVFVG